MKFLFLSLAVLIATVGMAVLAYQDPGYVLISRSDWALETSFSFFLAALVVAFVALYASVRFIINAWRLPAHLRALRRYRRTARARRLGQKGLLELAEGQWEQAERDLIRSAVDSDTPLLNYLGAVRAAQHQGAAERRDNYLALALQVLPEAGLAVGITQAELHLAQGELRQALATLTPLRDSAPRQSRLLSLCAQTYERLGAWLDLSQLIPDLRRAKALEEAEIDRLEEVAYARRLDEAVRSGQIGKLRELWENIPRHLHGNPTVAGTFARHLACLGEGAEAEELLREILKQHWEPELVRLYGLVRGRDLNRQLATAESWLKSQERNAGLLLTLGRICLQNRLWGKARTYLEASLGMDPRPETYRELAVLLQQFKEQERAVEYFRKGLELSVGANACTNFRMEGPAEPRHNRTDERGARIEDRSA